MINMAKSNNKRIYIFERINGVHGMPEMLYSITSFKRARKNSKTKECYNISELNNRVYVDVVLDDKREYKVVYYKDFPIPTIVINNNKYEETSIEFNILKNVFINHKLEIYKECIKLLNTIPSIENYGYTSYDWYY